MKLNLFLKLSLLLSLPVVCIARNNEIPLESDVTPHLSVSNEQIDGNYDLEQDIEQIESEIEEKQQELQNTVVGSDRASQSIEELDYLNAELEENKELRPTVEHLRVLREENEIFLSAISRNVILLSAASVRD